MGHKTPRCAPHPTPPPERALYVSVRRACGLVQTAHGELRLAGRRVPLPFATRGEQSCVGYPPASQVKCLDGPVIMREIRLTHSITRRIVIVVSAVWDFRSCLAPRPGITQGTRPREG